MSMDCDGKSTPKFSDDFAELYQQLEEHHRLGMAMNSHLCETAHWTNDDHARWLSQGANVIKKISEARLSDSSKIMLKARAVEMVLAIDTSGNSLND